MSESSAGFESELRVSPKLVIAVLPVLGIVLYMVIGAPSSNPSVLMDYTLLLFLLCAVSAASWQLIHWNHWVGRWFTILALIAIVHLVNARLDVPGSLALVAIPVALSSAMINLGAATLTAAGETLLLIVLLRHEALAVDPPAGVVALVAIWTTLGVMYAVYQPVRRIAQWSWEYFERTQSLLEEARDRQVELKQVVDDLAHANLQLTRLNILAQRLRQAAEDARTSKEQFVANVSHELRTPLNMIVGFSEMILQAPETYGSQMSPALLADLTVVHRNAQHLADLIDDVLDLSQIETNQMALTKERVRFHEIVEAAAIAVRPLLDSKGLYLMSEIPADLPSVFCDRTRIREVMLNLLSNAGRFTERGGIHVRAWQEGNDVVVAVADTGMGIAAEALDKLFQPFQQVDGSIRRRYDGSGLGLCISKGFIELHKGSIWVESEEGVGTTIFFRLPLEPPVPMDSDFSRWLDPSWEYVERTRSSMAPTSVVLPRFVVLETKDALQRLLTRYLGGIEIVPVTSLEEALQELSDSPSQAFLMNDESMGGAFQRLESITLPHDTPVMVCSVPGTHESAGALGVSDYLVKPTSS